MRQTIACSCFDVNELINGGKKQYVLKVSIFLNFCLHGMLFCLTKKTLPLSIYALLVQGIFRLSKDA